MEDVIDIEMIDLEEELLKSDTEEEPTSPLHSEESIEVISLPGSASPASTVPAPSRDPPRGEGESMSVDMEEAEEVGSHDNSVVEEVMREEGEAPESSGQNSQDSEDSQDEDYVYAPLRPFMSEIKPVMSEGLLRSLQQVHDRLVDRIRRRPCMFSGPFCIGKAKEVRPPTVSAARHTTISERVLLVDASSQVEKETTDQSTQTPDISHEVTAKEGAAPTPKTSLVREPLEAQDKENRRGQERHEQERRRARSIDRERVLGMVGWHTILGRPTYVSAPKPGCWACGRGEGHRLNNCPYRPVGYRYCYRCGLGGVTVKECPLHGENWAAQGPYVHQLGRNLPRERHWRDEPDSGRGKRRRDGYQKEA